MDRDQDLQTLLESFDRRDWQTAESGTVRIATVGLGWWTRERALPAIAAADRCETTVLVTGDPGRATGLVDRLGAAERAISYEAFHDGEATDAYDAVYVSTPNGLHLPHVEAAADLGKHVLCEKPMEASADRAERLVAACESAGVRLMVAYRMQTEPAIRRMRELVRAGVVGEPAHVESHMTQRLLAMDDDPGQWRLDPELVGPGAAVTDLGIYSINTARFVLEAAPASVQAAMASTAPAFADVPDERASYVLTFDDGTLAACSTSQRAHDGGRFAVIGTAGRVALDPAFFGDARRRLVVARGDATASIAVDPVDQMTEEFAYFADRVLTGAEIEPDGEQGLADVRTIEAVYEAARARERVDL